MDFSRALVRLKVGEKIARAGWNGKNMYVKLLRPTEQSEMTTPYLFLRTAQGDLVPWLCSQTDMLADDWTVVS